MFCFNLKANKVDAFVHRQLAQLDPNTQYSANLATWVLHHTLSAMTHFTLAGFELELYATHEYHYVFWSAFLFWSHHIFTMFYKEKNSPFV